MAELSTVCRELGASRLLWVSDPVVSELEPIRRGVERCRESGLSVRLFRDFQPDPTGANVDSGVDAFREAGCDAVVAVGGGSSLDAGKAIAFMVGQERPLWDFEDREDWHTRADATAIAPVVAVPTTAGTGSEVGRAAVITDESGPAKKIIFHPAMLPRVVVADPELTLGLPRGITVATAMDALAHNLEAYCAPGMHPMADGIALEGIRLIKEALPSAAADGGDLAARSFLMAAASMGAVAFQKGLGAVHALSHPIGAVFGSHHGLTNGVLLPYVLAFNRFAVEDRMVTLARHLELEERGFDGVLRWLLDLRADLDVPHTLSGLGVGEDSIDRLAPMAAADPTCAGNPVPVGETELAALYRSAIRGELAGVV